MRYHRTGHRRQGLRFYSKYNSKTLGGFQEVSNLIQDLVRSFCCYGRKEAGRQCERKETKYLLQQLREEMVVWSGQGAKMRERLWRTDKPCSYITGWRVCKAGSKQGIKDEGITD